MSNINKNSFSNSMLNLIDKYPEFFAFVGIMMAIVFMLIIFTYLGTYQMTSIRDSRLDVCTKFESVELRDQCRTEIVNGGAEKNDRR